jgi:hypothetical protein
MDYVGSKELFSVLTEKCLIVLKSAIHRMNGFCSFSESMQSDGSSEKVKRKKTGQHEHQRAYEQNANSRIDNAARQIEVKKDAQDGLSATDRVRNISIEETEVKKKERSSNNEKYNRKGETRITENKLRIEQRKRSRQDSNSDRSLKTLWTRLKAKWESARLKRQDERKASEQRIRNSELRAQQRRAKDEELRQGLNSHSRRNAKKIEHQKKEIEITTKGNELNSVNERFDARTAAHRKKGGNPKSEDDYLPVPGAENLKEGVTESSYKMGNKMVTERIVKVGNRVDRYKKVVSKTSIYYFCNDRSITDQIWRQATLAQPE